MKARGSGRFKKEKILQLAGESLLEVGCGQGKYTAFAASCGKEAFAVDTNLSVLLQAQREFGGRFILADAHNLPLGDKSFDTVCLYDVLEHVKDDMSALREAVRVARKNILITVPKEDSAPDSSAGVTFRTYTDSSHRRYYTRESLAKLVQSAGARTFAIEEFDRIRPALAYARAGFPRFPLSILDRIMWFFSAHRSAMYRNLFARADVPGREK